MARPPSSQPTDAELEILKVLWEHGPAGLGQVHAAIQESRPVALTTIATTLKVYSQRARQTRGRLSRLPVDSGNESGGRRVGAARKARPSRLRRLGPAPWSPT